jgi:hypothetical protein
MAAENKSAEVGDDAFGKVLSLAKYPTVETRIREREYKAFSSVKSWNVWTDTPGVCREIVGKFGDGKD